jgi:hypothetical protein
VAHSAVYTAPPRRYLTQDTEARQGGHFSGPGCVRASETHVRLLITGSNDRKHALIEDPLGPIRRRIARSIDDLVSRMPTPQEAVSLRLPQGVPVTRVLRTVLDSQDRPVEVQESIAAADRHEFRYEVAMDRDDQSL